MPAARDLQVFDTHGKPLAAGLLADGLEGSTAIITTEPEGGRQVVRTILLLGVQSDPLGGGQAPAGPGRRISLPRRPRSIPRN